jgi:hypothetical protein
MYVNLSEHPQGNLFAIELEKALARHVENARLGMLEYHSGIHPEKVRQLKKSLDTPGKFPTLNPDELESVIATPKFHLESERMTLRAAILATSIQKLLFDQDMTPSGALTVARQVMPTILEKLQAVTQNPTLAGSFRDLSTQNGGATMEEALEALLDNILESSLQAIDRGTLTLHLVAHVRFLAEREEQAQEAGAAFTSALELLDSAERRVQTDSTFAPVRAEALARIAIWRQEAQNGQAIARTYLM